MSRITIRKCIPPRFFKLHGGGNSKERELIEELVGPALFRYLTFELEVSKRLVFWKVIPYYYIRLATAPISSGIIGLLIFTLALLKGMFSG